MVDGGPTGAPAEQERAGRSGRWFRLALGAAVWLTGSVLAFLVLDLIVASLLAILGGTAVLMAATARDWDRHSTFEERELARARRRAERRERTKEARARDRARWEAHQARRAGKSAP